MVFQGIRTSIAKKAYNVVIFFRDGGVRTPGPFPLGSVHAIPTPRTKKGILLSDHFQYSL